MYKKDILLYTGLKARLIKRKKFELVCSASRKQYQFGSEEAGQWVNMVNKLIKQMG